MTFDAWTVAAVADELTNAVLGGRVQQVVQTDEVTLAFELYVSGQRCYLVASASQQAPRLFLSDVKQRRGVDSPSPLLQLLRKFVRGSTLTGILQPPWERILHLEFHHPQYGESLLIAELIGRWANLLLVRPSRSEDGGEGWRILESVRRFRPGDPAARTVLPGKLYEPPPPQGGLAPDSLTELQLRVLLEAAQPETALWRLLVQALQGISPQLAREIVFRATGSPQVTVSQVARLLPVLEAVEGFVGLMEAAAWDPCVVMGVGDRVLAFAPYPLTHRRDGRVEPVETISQAAERAYGPALPVAADAYAAARQQVAHMIQRARVKTKRQMEAIQRELRSPEEIEQLRAAGEWILALATQIVPRQAELVLPEGAGIDSVALEPALTPADNAAAYFKRYRKAKRAAQFAGRRLVVAEQDLAYLEQLATDLELAVNRNDIDTVRGALLDSGLLRRPAVPRQPTPSLSQPHRFSSSEGYVVLVGRNSRQNERVTFDLAAPDDLWLHVRGEPGAHVVIRNGGRPVTDETLRQVAAVAAYYSRARSESWADVMVTERRRVRRAPGQRPGMVVVDGEQVLRVRPRPWSARSEA